MIPSTSIASSPARLAPALWLIAVAHSLNDLFQAVLPSLYPELQIRFQLSYSQLGLITLMFHLIGSLCQPVVGWYTDHRPSPRLLPWAMMCMIVAMTLLAFADGFTDFLWVAAAVGLGSSIFHPEGSRAARAASEGRLGLAQSVFQLGGNIGSAVAPLLLATLLIMPIKHMALCLAGLAVCGLLLLRRALQISRSHIPSVRFSSASLATLSRGKKIKALLLLTLLLLSKYIYLACIANFYTFFLIERFAVTIAQAQILLFVFLLAITAGTLLGGPLVDRLGMRPVITLSILGACPFALWLPHAPPGGGDRVVNSDRDRHRVGVRCNPANGPELGTRQDWLGGRRLLWPDVRHQWHRRRRLGRDGGSLGNRRNVHQRKLRATPWRPCALVA